MQCYTIIFIAVSALHVSGVRLSRTLPGTQYTHHSLKSMLPQHCNTYNDVFLLINSTKVQL